MPHKVVEYCLMSCDTIVMIHGLRTIEAAMELFKIAQLYSYMCVQCMQLCASAAYTVLLCWHCCRKRYRDAFSTAVKILPITELHLGPAHTQVIELKFIITLARENS